MHITDALLRQLALRNNFAIPSKGLVFFGIRGALPLDISGIGFAPAHELRHADLDHIHMRCTLGQWQPEKKLIAVFPGSTVPCRRYIGGGLPKRGVGVNMLMLGLYEYETGQHLSGKPNGHRAFRQSKFFPVWRTSDDLDYDLDDRLDLGRSSADLVWDNLHCAYHDSLESEGYSSAGCQVIAGQPKSRRRENRPETGPWKRFVEHAYDDFRAQKTFTYGLYSAFELQTLQTGHPDQISQSLRFGSTGPLVVQLQTHLLRQGFDLQKADGDFGRATLEVLMAFQTKEFGLGKADGVVGSNTAAALEFALPPLSAAIPAPASIRAQPEPASDIPEPDDDDDDGSDLERIIRPALREMERAADTTVAAARKEVRVQQDEDGNWTAHINGGDGFYIGHTTRWSSFAGIFQPSGRLKTLPGGKFNPADWQTILGAEGPWAWFLLPTIMAESGGYFGRVNTYDGAGLTFGPLQFASHTPKDNLILVFRKLLELPDADAWFPDLALKNGQVHRLTATGLQNLESRVSEAGRLVDFMEYLNPDAHGVTKTEAENAARLIAWCADNQAAKHMQISVAIERLRGKVDRLRSKFGVHLDKYPIYCAIWVADILHHGRGKYAQMQAAFDNAAPENVLSSIGAGDSRWADRVKTVKDEIKKLRDAKHLDTHVWGQGAFAVP
jgi:hypothetical protein